MGLFPPSPKSKAFPRARAFPLRIRYVAITAIFFVFYYSFTPGTATSPQQYVPILRPDGYVNPPPTSVTVQQKHADVLKEAAILNDSPPDLSDSTSAPDAILDAPYVDVAGTEAHAQRVAEAMGGKSAGGNDVAQIVRLHNGGSDVKLPEGKDATQPEAKNVKQPETKPIDPDPLEKLEPSKPVGNDIESAVTGVETAEAAPKAIDAALEEGKISSTDTFFTKEEDTVAAAALAQAASNADITPPVEAPAAAPKIVAEPASTISFKKTTSASVVAAKPSPGAFKDFDFLFAFGDSWTYTAFDLAAEQPSHANPMGNPAAPINGVSAPPEWLYYMTTKYNGSFLRTYNIARGAATVDRAVVPPHPGFAFTWTFKEQAADAFGLKYSRPTPDIPWATANSLFAVWFGVVDIALLLEREEWTEALNTQNLDSYAASLETLYHFGARRFLLLTCPPLARMPGAQHKDVSLPAVDAFNQGLANVQKSFLAKHASDIEAEVYLFDVHALLEGIIDDPAITAQTSKLKNTTENCWNYNPDANPSTQKWDRFDDECGVPYNQYFWANPLHPTYPVHEAIAARIVSDCFSVKGTRSGYCT